MMNDNQNISLPVIIELDEDNVFIVSCPIFKGCHSYGHTIDEAMENLNEAIEMCLEESDLKFDNINKYVGIREISLPNKSLKLFEYA
jgi:predicted RNase H-like HicB family nuclease